MSTKADRGTKRRCQNDECRVNFYDLSRPTITCPICGSGYQPPAALVPKAASWRPSRPLNRRPEIRPATEPAVEAELVDAEAGTDELAAIEVPEAADAPEEVEAVLEPEEEGDVTSIIGDVADENEQG